MCMQAQLGCSRGLKSVNLQVKAVSRQIERLSKEF